MASTPSDIHTFTSRRGAAQRANVSTDTIDRRIADGSLRAYRFGTKTIRIKVSDLDALFTDVGMSAADRVAADPFDGLTDEQVAKLTAAVDLWPTLPPEQRETLASLFAVRQEAS